MVCTVFESLCPDFIEQQGKDDGGGKVDHKLKQAKQRGIAQQAAKVRPGEEAFKIQQADPLAAKEAFGQLEILKCHDKTGHWRIAKEQIPCYNDRSHEPNGLVAYKVRVQIVGQRRQSAPFDIP